MYSKVEAMENKATACSQKQLRAKLRDAEESFRDTGIVTHQENSPV